MKKIRSIEIWEVKDTYYLTAYSVTTVGLRNATDNPVHILTKEQQHRLGEESLLTLQECQYNVPHPDPDVKKYKEANAPFLKLVGMPSWGKLIRNGKCVDVIHMVDRIRVHPTFFDGKHLTGERERDLFCSLDPDDITRTILEAFATRCGFKFRPPAS